MRKFTLTKHSLDEIAALPHVRPLAQVDTGNPDDEGESAILGCELDAPGAWPRGTRVVKAWNEEGDTHALGAAATVRGSMLRKDYPFAVELEPNELIYCVEWDDTPNTAVFCRGKKLARVD